MNIEQLKQILDNAPLDAEFIDADIHEDGNRILTRSLADIRQIVELSEQVEKLKRGLSAIANWEKCSPEDVNEVVKLLQELTK